jgi:hypothetical protein
LQIIDENLDKVRESLKLPEPEVPGMKEYLEKI